MSFANAVLEENGPESKSVGSRRTHSYWLLARRFLRRPFSLVGLVILAVFVTTALFASWVAPFSPSATDFNAILSGPSSHHLLGTDGLGRDVLSRLIWGSRASLQAGVLATLLAMAIAVPIGVVAGYYGGWVDLVIARLTDVMLAFPFLILAIGLAVILSPSLTTATLALGIGTAPRMIRVARGESLTLREADFIRAAIANSASDAVILARHILPNMVSTLIVQGTLLIPAAIIGEATLSFLGFGVQPPAPSWGVMLADSQAYLTQAPTQALYPGLAIFLCSLSFNFVGDGLREILDPKTQR